MERKLLFCLSDDSHGTDQVALNYGRVLSFLDEVGITSVTFLQHRAPLEQASDARFRTLHYHQTELHELRKHVFWECLEK